ncbi:MAG: Holliday junction branch migration DNA helicase RuvB [Bavariicoccus seileri]|uniref:Holliday junction branch migration DNA helicase RuvB n=1 Tax=Bavariicoccus seileri TaxID=549685 RepID=UPI003F8F01D5
MTERIVSAEDVFDDGDNELSLRPQWLREYIGQEKLKRQLNIYIKATKQREESLDHILIYGPPGLGKTTLAHIIAHELDVNITTTSGPAIERSGDLVAILSDLNAGDVLFIDEIHRLPKPVEEILYSAMEDFFIDIVTGIGATAQHIHFPLPPFTLIGATTRAGALSAPLRDRFGIIDHIDYYTVDDLELIINRTARVLECDIDQKASLEIALRSRGTPRIANRLLRRVRDFSQVETEEIISESVTKKTLKILGVDRLGLDEIDRRLLLTMIKFYQGGPVGVAALAANVSEERETIEDMYEPYLLQNGFIQRTPRGRVATPKAYDHLGIPFPK